jgi:hypothetical protein
MAMRVTNDVRKLLAWLEGAPVSEAQIVAAGFNHTLDKALMLNFVEMNLPKATVFITARGLAALKATQHLRRAERLPIGSSRSLSLSPSISLMA